MTNTDDIFIESVSNKAVAIFHDYESKYWKSMYQQYMRSWLVNPVVSFEKWKKTEEEVKRKVSELDKRFTYAKIIVGVIKK